MLYTVKREDITLDFIVNQYYGASFGYLERVLQENVCLYDLDIYLPIGTQIRLPEIKEVAKQRESLWG